jgi:hypothetical protein
MQELDRLDSFDNNTPPSLHSDLKLPPLLLLDILLRYQVIDFAKTHKNFPITISLQSIHN